MKSIQTKMLLFILVPTIIFFGGTIAYITKTVNDMAVNEAENMLEADGDRVAKEIEAKFDAALHKTRSIATTVQGLLENGAKPTREEVNYILEQTLKNNPEYVSTWMYWEPNAFDGKDKEYANTESHDATGRFVPVWSRDTSGNLILEPIIGYDEGQLKEDIQSVISSGVSTVFEPFTYEMGGVNYFITSIVSPIQVNGKTVGVIGLDVTLDEMHEFVKEFTLYDSGFAGLITGEGTLVSYNNDEAIGENYYEVGGVNNYAKLEQLKEDVKNGNLHMMTGYSKALSKDVYRLFVPIQMNGTEQYWSTFVSAPVDEVMKEANQVRNAILIVGVSIAVILGVIIWLVTRSIVRPIQLVSDQMNHIANGDLTKELLKVKTKDETGKLANALNNMQQRLAEMIRNISNASNAMASQSEELNQAANEVSTGSEQMTKTMEELAIGSETQANRSSDIASMMGSFVSQIEKVHDDGRKVQQASQDVLQMTDQGRELMNTSMKQMTMIDEIVHDAVQKVEGLDQHSQQISELVAVIQDIAEQTNLLALNAAIEAARAGEHGKGFAVVADEVRKLAEESAQSVVNITKIVQRIQNESSHVADALREGYKEVEEGTQHIQTTGETFHEISDHVTNVVNSIDQISEILEDIVANSQEMSSAIEDIAAVSEESAAAVEEATATTEQTSASMEEVASSSNELAKLAEELNEIVQRFKL